MVPFFFNATNADAAQTKRQRQQCDSDQSRGKYSWWDSHSQISQFLISVVAQYGRVKKA